jgi:hypothetical protein
MVRFRLVVLGAMIVGLVYANSVLKAQPAVADLCCADNGGCPTGTQCCILSSPCSTDNSGWCRTQCSPGGMP